MGKRQRKQERSHDGHGDHSRAARPGRARGLRSHQVDAAIEAAVASCGLAVGPPASHLVEPLAAGVAPGSGGPPGAEADHRTVDRALARALADAVARAWSLGWQPADVHRAMARLHGRPHARLVADAIGCEARRHPAVEVAARWRRQLDAIGATGTAADEARPGEWVVAPGVARVAGVAIAIETLAALRRLPRLPHLGPAPGDPAPRQARGARAAVGADPRVLHKVTALLAKAESTTFPEEAESLTSKAQQLMTRHAIDQVALDAGRGGPRVGGRRIGIDDPYAGPRYLLLAAVADANRCRAVWSKVWGFATVFGDEGDLDAVELLYTSLLVQATRAMVVEAGGMGRVTPSAGRTRSFRQSFLVAFTGRIGARLREAAEAVTADAARRSASLLPALARRSEAADAAVDDAYPSVGRTRVSANDAAGWHAGAAAADRAQLDLHGALGGHAPDPSAVP